MERWSGPSRALQEHQHLYRESAQSDRYLRAHRGKGMGFADFAATEHRQFWLSFSKTYSSHTKILFDGLSNGYWREPGNDQLWTPANVQVAATMIDLEHTMADQGTTYYVAEPIVDLITRAAELAEPEPLFATDLPTAQGFAVMERPWLVMDLHPDTGDVLEDVKVPIRAIGWTTTHVGSRDDHTDRRPGVIVFFYTDGKSYEEVYLPQLAALNPDKTFFPDGVRRYGPMVMDVNPWQYGTSWEDGGMKMDDEDAYKLLSNVAFMRRWVLAFMRLMWQELLVAPTTPFSRPQRRTWQRFGREIPEDGGIKIVQLRRLRYPEHLRDKPEPDAEREWTMSYRAPTRGHTRRQHYRSLGPAYIDGKFNPASHRRIWIDGFWRGPEDGPVVLKHPITELIR